MDANVGWIQRRRDDSWPLFPRRFNDSRSDSRAGRTVGLNNRNEAGRNSPASGSLQLIRRQLGGVDRDSLGGNREIVVIDGLSSGIEWISP